MTIGEIALVIGVLFLLGVGSGFGGAIARDWRRGKHKLDVVPNTIVDIGGVKWRVMGAEASVSGYDQRTELRVTFVATEPHKVEMVFDGGRC